ncbi:hypothetical protein LG293_09875 [Citricoccus nitrophenolicus]
MNRKPGRDRRVIIESPYAGDVDANTDYARRCMADSLSRGEAPFASHLLYTQPGVLDDTDPDERQDGIEAGLVWGRTADLTAVYVDHGVSAGMSQGILRAGVELRPVEYRKLEGSA